MKFEEQAQKRMYFKCLAQESIPHFLLPTKERKIFGKNLKMVVAREPNRSLRPRHGTLILMTTMTTQGNNRTTKRNKCMTRNKATNLLAAKKYMLIL
jgi:hypothetical protein